MLIGKKLTNEDLNNSFPFIKKLAELIVTNGLCEIEIKKGDISIRINRVSASLLTQSEAMQQTKGNFLPQNVPLANFSPASNSDNNVTGAIIQETPEQKYKPEDILKSPMVGTTYLSPSPGSDRFVRIGDEVSKGQTVMIIEAMKTMNHISAHKSGIVRAIFVEDEDPVEYDQDLVIIE